MTLLLTTYQYFEEGNGVDGTTRHIQVKQTKTVDLTRIVIFNQLSSLPSNNIQNPVSCKEIIY